MRPKPQMRRTRCFAGARKGVCALCGRHTHLSFHHLIPRKLHRRAHFRKHYQREELSRGVNICRLCHDGIHALYDEMTLARSLRTITDLKADARIRRHAAWVRKQRLH